MSAIACSSAEGDAAGPEDDVGSERDGGPSGGHDASSAVSDDAALGTKDGGGHDTGLTIDGGASDDAAASQDAGGNGNDASAASDAGADADAGPPKLTLAWDDNSTNEDGFAIDKKVGTGGTYAELATVPANVTTYVDYAVVRGTTYCYQIRAFNDGGTSVPSAEACASPK